MAALINSIASEAASPSQTFDLVHTSVRELNGLLHKASAGEVWHVTRPRGQHNIACGLDQEISVDIHGHTGYYCAGMNEHAAVTVHGNAGVGVAENMMSGTVRVHGNASQSAGATGNGGLLVIDGDASARCGISMKGIDIVVGGNVGHMSAFMGQAGRLVVCGDAGDGLGDSLYEARLYVRGTVGSLGADCVEKPMNDEHRAELAVLLRAAGFDHAPEEFRRYGSARQLYRFQVDDAD
jgi:methylamine---glutamate N-methyltransferase subunit B